jgi:hypothetical protein
MQLPSLDRSTALFVRIEAVSLVLVAATGGLLAIRAASPQHGVPVLAQVNLGGDRLPVLVVPGRPGPNLVHIGADGVTVGLHRASMQPATARPGSTGTWAVVDLPPGRSRLWVGRDGATDPLTVDAGDAPTTLSGLAGPAGPECASALLGALLTSRTREVTSCPADRLSVADGESLRAMVRFVAARKVRGVGIVTDSTPRGVQAAELLRAAAVEAGLAVHPPGARLPLFVVSSWSAAEVAIHRVAASTIAAEGTYLAPWLLSSPLLTPPAGQLLALHFDPRDETALRYLSTLSTRFPGEQPTAVGFDRWLGSDGAGPLRLYAASQVFVPGTAGEHHHGGAAWVPDGTVTAVTGPLAA